MILAFCCLLPAWAAAAAPPMMLDGLLGGGPSGQARTIDGESVWLDQIRFSTPRDFEKLDPGQQIYTFDTNPQAPRFEAIQEFSFETMTEELIGSRPEALETYRLGNARITVPPPPDWKRSYDQIPPWSRAVAAQQTDHLPFINGAVACWVAGPSAPSGANNVYLFRQHFELRQHDRLARATLRLATNADPIELAVNDHPVELATKVGYRLASYEITPLLQPGINIVAIRLAERPLSTEPPGLAFHIELLRRAKDTAPPPIRQTDALLTNKQGDRIWGNVHDMNNDGIGLDSPYGRYRIDWNDCGSVLFPAAWHEEPPEPTFVQRVRGRAPVPVALPLYGLPLKAAPSPIQDCLLLTENRRTTARPGYARDGQLNFEGIDGKKFAMPINHVLAIYPPQPLEVSFQRPRSETAILFCRLMTTRGEQLSGLLRQLRGSEAVLETDASNFLTIKTPYISTIYFPYHSANQSGARPSTQKIGIMPLLPGAEAYRVAYQNDLRRVQAADFSIDADTVNLGVETLADTAQLNPARLPVLVNIDPVGEYLHTLGSTADAQNALLRYVEEGGRLIVLARGGAFRTTVLKDGGQMRRTPADMTRPNLLDQIGAKVSRPPAAAGAAIVPFNHPPNDGRTIFFQRSSQLPHKELFGLERRVQLGSMVSAPFYPMVASSGAITLYDLRDENSRIFGPALQIIPKGRGFVVVIDHLLWESEIDDVPFSESELPKLLRWALNITS